MAIKKYQGGAVNKFNKDATDTNNGYLNNTFLRDDNTTSVSSAWAVSEYIDISGISTLSAKNANTTSIITAICYYNDSKTFISGTAYNGTTTQTFTVPSNAKYCRMSYVKPASNTMLVEGLTIPSEYHPYYEWNTIPYRKYGTSTDTITTLPADLYADGTNATVGLVGNMSQTGTPTPQTPIQPSECGERTKNLFDRAILQNNKGINTSGAITDTTGRIATVTPIDVSQYTAVTLSYTSNSCSFIFATFNGGTLVDRQASKTSGYTIDVTNCDKLYICFYRASDISTNDVTEIMLNTGSTALPYEPYGYKIPISSASTTTPVYLGEVETTRKIGKLVMDGTELWQFSSSDSNRTVCYINQSMSNVVGYCSHILWKSSYETSDYNRIVYLSSQGGLLYISLDNALLAGQMLQDFKTWLQQQYANGTPVTIWYVLANETTGIVNEPIRKIGDYADTVSGITIPTITGKDTFDVQTTLKPSEVSLAYTGWHNASVGEWDGSEWQ